MGGCTGVRKAMTEKTIKIEGFKLQAEVGPEPLGGVLPPDGAALEDPEGGLPAASDVFMGPCEGLYGEELCRVLEGGYQREIEDALARAVLAMQSMQSTYSALASLAGADVARMEETERSFLGRFFNASYAAEKEALAAVIDAFAERMASGSFASSRAIIEDIWTGAPGLRRGLSILSGFYDGEAGGLAELFSKRWGDHVTLADIIDQEEKPDPEGLARRLETVVVNGDGHSAAQAAYVAQSFRARADYSGAMGEFISGNFEERKAAAILRDALKGSLEPVNVATMIGGFALAKLTATAVMAKLSSAGVGGLSLASKAGMAIAETGVESAAFTFYHRALTSMTSAQDVDWGAKGVAADAAILWLSLGFMRGANVPLAALKKKVMSPPLRWAPGDKLASPRALSSTWSKWRGAFALAENAAQLTAFWAGPRVGYELGLSEGPPSFLEQGITFAELSLGFMLAGRLSGGWLGRKTMEIRLNPVLRVVDGIAGALTHADPMLKVPLTRQLALAAGKGMLSPADLIAMKRAIEKKGAVSKEVIPEVNSFIKKAGIDMVYDGFYLSVPEKPQDKTKLKRRGKIGPVSKEEAKGKEISAISMGVLDLNEITKKTAFGAVHENLADMLIAKESRGEGNRANVLLAGPGNGNLALQLYEWFGSTLAIHRWDSAHIRSKTFLQPKLYDRIIALDALRGIEPSGRLQVVSRLVDSLAKEGEIIFSLPVGGEDPLTASMRKPSADLLRALEKSGYKVVMTTRLKEGVPVEDVLIRKNVENELGFSEIFESAIGPSAFKAGLD